MHVRIESEADPGQHRRGDQPAPQKQGSDYDFPIHPEIVI
jgi:hypothetical protein